MKTITLEQIKEMQKLKAKGLGIYQIAKKMGLAYLIIAYYVGGYRQKISHNSKLKRLLGYVREISLKQYSSADVIALKGTPTDLGDGLERWEFKVFIGKSEPRTEKYINIIKGAGKTKALEQVDKR